MNKRINLLRKKFKKYNIDGYIVSKNDDYFTEYSKINRLEVISNFTGSAGLAIILKNKNYLFTDGRYTIQSQMESGKDFKIINYDKIINFDLVKNLTLGIDPKLFTYEQIKKFFLKNNKINNDWNSLNTLSCDAATVGNYDLKLINKDKNLLKDLKDHKFEIVYLVGQDNLNFEKKDEFVIYQGSHGDKGAELADIILPGSAYTEQDGYFTNLEGKLQKAYKASYPPGESKEDWLIINEIAEFMNNRKLFNDKDELESSMFNYLNLQKEKHSDTKNNEENDKANEFNNEMLKIKIKDYYFSNVIARSSKTMIECNNSKLNLKSTGTEG